MSKQDRQRVRSLRTVEGLTIEAVGLLQPKYAYFEAISGDPKKRVAGTVACWRGAAICVGHCQRSSVISIDRIKRVETHTGTQVSKHH